MPNSLTEENYLKAIYKLMEKDGSPISTNAIAGKMSTKAASVTDMLKKLANKKLIHYEKYKGVSLSKKGEKIAIDIIRKHRLWEFFLVEKLNFNWDEVHNIAEELEHINSSKLIEQLDKFLNYPKVDPHGDPIPDADGNFHSSNSQLLSQIKKGTTSYMTGVVDHSPAFLRYLDQLGISLGDTIKIREIIEYDRSLKISLNQKQSIYISNEVAKNILVAIS